MMYRTVTVQPRIINPVISVTPTIYSRLIKADAKIITQLAHSDMPQYEGAYEFTPSEETQIAPTAHTSVVENIVINPIPDNYARMAWNGHTILFY